MLRPGPPPDSLETILGLFSSTLPRPNLADHEIPLLVPTAPAERSRFTCPPPVERNDAPYVWDLETDRLLWGDGARDVLDRLSLPTVRTGSDFARFIRDPSAATRYDAVFSAGQQDGGDGVPFTAKYPLTVRENGGRDDVVRWVEDRGRWFAGPDGRPQRVEGSIIGVGKPQTGPAPQSELRIGRAALIAAIETEIRTAASIEPGTAVLLIGLEDATLTRQTFGHAVAEVMIQAATDHLRAAIRRSDAIVRWPENGCAVVLRACGPKQAEIVGRRLLDSFDTFTVASSVGSLETRVVIGAAASTSEEQKAATVVQQAEDALDHARADRTLRFVLHDEKTSLDADRQRAQATTQTILASLDQEGVTLAFQPIVSARTREVAFYEALIRLVGPDGRLVQPGSIFPVAESSGLVRRLDRRGLQLAVQHLLDHPDRTVSVNVSPLSAHDAAWIETALELANNHPEAMRRLIIEITESAAIGDLDATQSLIAALQSRGIRVAMDDFGAGHSSFRNLRRLKFDLLKLDGAFVQNLPRSPDDACFVRALLDLAQHLGIPTVAEWVEDEESAALLVDWGATYFQGHLFGRAE